MLYKMVNGKKEVMTAAEEAAITKEWDLNLQQMAVQAVMDKRMRAYPSVKEQLDLLYKDMMNGTSVWKDMITKIKAENPI